MIISFRFFFLLVTTCYQAIACWFEDRKTPPGQLYDLGGYRLHLYTLGEGKPTVILDHSLGGVEGYLLIEKLAQLTKVCIYDRAGYGWSDSNPYPRTSEQIVKELNLLLTQAKIEPPYILIGNSFGSYNVRLYAATFPEQVVGMVLTDGLHERKMLRMPLQLQALRLFFISGFVMSILGSIFGIIRLLSLVRVFELLKPELPNFSPKAVNFVKRSFLRPKHWLTMIREMLNLTTSARQISQIKRENNLPIVSIKANSFFKASWWTWLIPLHKANWLREQMHLDLLKLSPNCLQLHANQSGHFVWVDQPDVIVNAVKIILEQVSSSGFDSGNY